MALAGLILTPVSNSPRRANIYASVRAHYRHLYRDGEPIHQIVGAKPKRLLLYALDERLEGRS